MYDFDFISTPDQLGALMGSDVAKFAEVINNANIQLKE